MFIEVIVAATQLAFCTHEEARYAGCCWSIAIAALILLRQSFFLQQIFLLYINLILILMNKLE